jgi:hypothetical protein
MCDKEGCAAQGIRHENGLSQTHPMLSIVQELQLSLLNVLMIIVLDIVRGFGGHAVA